MQGGRETPPVADTAAGAIDEGYEIATLVIPAAAVAAAILVVLWLLNLGVAMLVAGIGVAVATVLGIIALAWREDRRARARHAAAEERR